MLLWSLRMTLAIKACTMTKAQQLAVRKGLNRIQMCHEVETIISDQFIVNSMHELYLLSHHLL